MLKIFPIDFIRQAFEQKLLEEHNKDQELFGGKDQVNIFSFYEQLKSQDEVDRFVENYRDLADQQNRTGLILNGVLVSPENPTITNLYSSLIIPLSFTCSMRCLIGNRDQAIWTINNLIDKLKGRKVDIAQLNCVDAEGKKYSVPFMVGTIGQNEYDPSLKDGDYLGDVTNANDTVNKIDAFGELGIKTHFDTDIVGKDRYYYVKHGDILKVVKTTKSFDKYYDVKFPSVGQPYDNVSKVDLTFQINEPITMDDLTKQIVFNLTNGVVNPTVYENIRGTIKSATITQTGTATTVVAECDISDIELPEPPLGIYTLGATDVKVQSPIYLKCVFIEDDGTTDKIVFPPEHTSFEKYKVSFSFDAIRCDEPRNLNAEEYCELSFGGSATLVNASVQLGNDLLKVYIRKDGFQAETWVSFEVNGYAPGNWLEPLEMPSGSNANTQINQLVSNRFISNSHTDAIALTLQYTFIYDKSSELLKQWFEYARYGWQPDGEYIPYRNGITPNIIYGIIEIWSSWGEIDINGVPAKIVENIDIENTESDTLTLSLTFQIQGENTGGNGDLS